MSFHVPEHLRVDGPEGSNNGAFRVPSCAASNFLYVIASDGQGWEHVSTSLKHRIASWEEMSQLKNLFWDPQDCVVQFHPPESDYVNCHPFCLHLWRPIGRNLETPPSILVGPK